MVFLFLSYLDINKSTDDTFIFKIFEMTPSHITLLIPYVMVNSFM